MSEVKRFLIVQSAYYQEIADYLLKGTVNALQDESVAYDVVDVAGALEIPLAIKIGAQTEQYDAYIALGCVLRGETSHYDIVAGESARALMDLGLRHDLIIGNGILTCETKEQAMVRADPAQKNKGADAVQAALSLLDLKEKLITEKLET